MKKDIDRSPKYKEQKPKTHRVVCCACGEVIEFNSDDILKQWDETRAFKGFYTKSVRCPYCNERNIIENKDINGKIHKVKIEKI